jgi:phosphatidate phosphatase APP1
MSVEKKYKTKRTIFQRIKRYFFIIFRLSSGPAVRLYHGFGNGTNCYLYGHALSLSPLPRKRYRKNFILNTLALLRLFIVKPINNATLQLQWEGQTYTSTSEYDGFFKFEWQPVQPLAPGTYHMQVELLHRYTGQPVAAGKAELIVPAKRQFAFISDIDDTFLISHSSNLRKRLFVLLTENAHSRKPFDGVVNHYRLLSEAGGENRNAFFYVSSSEWNLYDYIREFCAQNKLPDGVYLLNQLKSFGQIFKTGQNNHGTKFIRIVRILEAYPDQQFILLGDDSQEDPNIYASVVSHFKQQIFCVYIRTVGKTQKRAVAAKLKEIEIMGTACCYFRHSEEAILHSIKTGLVKTAEPVT